MSNQDSRWTERNGQHAHAGADVYTRPTIRCHPLKTCRCLHATGCCPICDLLSPTQDPLSLARNPSTIARDPSSPARGPSSPAEDPSLPAEDPSLLAQDPLSPTRDPLSADCNRWRACATRRCQSAIYSCPVCDPSSALLYPLSPDPTHHHFPATRRLHFCTCCRPIRPIIAFLRPIVTRGVGRLVPASRLGAGKVE